jgi:hypothetical protein
VPKKAQFTQERVEYNVFLLDEPFKGSKAFKIFKISLTFRFDKLSDLSKFVHIIQGVLEVDAFLVTRGTTHYS